MTHSFIANGLRKCLYLLLFPHLTNCVSLAAFAQVTGDDSANAQKHYIDSAGFTDGGTSNGTAPQGRAIANVSAATNSIVANQSVSGAGIGRASFSDGFSGSSNVTAFDIANHGSSNLPYTATSSVDIDVTSPLTVASDVFLAAQHLGIDGRELNNSLLANQLDTLIRFRMSTKEDLSLDDTEVLQRYLKTGR